MTKTEKPGLKQTLSWSAPIVLFYVAFSAFLLLVSYIVQDFGIPADSYLLSISNPFTVLAAPFTGSLADSSSNAEVFLLFLLVFVMILEFDQDFLHWWRFRLFFCVIPIISGIIASALYLIPMHISGLARDGSGGSIIAAGLNGILVVLIFAAFSDNLRMKRYVETLFSLVLLFVMVYVFRVGFLDAGNASAHLYGFMVSIPMTALYLWVAKGRRNDQIAVN